MGLHAERQGEGAPRVTLVHGFTQTGRSWLALAAALARDHEVVAVDAPGHGGSSTVEADVSAGARLLGEAGGTGVYVGYSMGGRLCLHLALEQPAVVRGVVLLGATGGLDDDEERQARRLADERLAADLERDGVDAFLDRWLANPLFATLPAAAIQREDRRRNTVPGLASSLRLAGTGAQAPLWPRLASLEMPVLVVAGETDAKFTAVGHRLVASIGPNAQFSAIPSAGHAAHLEQPAAFLALLQRWLGEYFG